MFEEKNVQLNYVKKNFNFSKEDIEVLLLQISNGLDNKNQIIEK